MTKAAAGNTGQKDQKDWKRPSRKKLLASASKLLEGAMARAGLEGNHTCLTEARRMAREMVSAL